MVSFAVNDCNKIKVKERAAETGSSRNLQRQQQTDRQQEADRPEQLKESWRNHLFSGNLLKYIKLPKKLRHFRLHEVEEDVCCMNEEKAGRKSEALTCFPSWGCRQPG